MSDKPVNNPCKYCIYVEKIGFNYWCHRDVKIKFNEVTSDSYKSNISECYIERIGNCKGDYFEPNFTWKILDYIARKWR